MPHISSVPAVVMVLSLSLIGGVRAQEEAAALQVWSSDIHDRDDAKTDGPPAMHLIGARNGVCSGKVVVASAAPIHALKVTAGDLTCGNAVMPAAAVAIRYGVEWDPSFRGRSRPRGKDVLLEAPPEELPPGGTAVWLIVEVPRDAAAGSYAGALTVEAQGAQPVHVPVKLDVQDWTVPSAADFRTWVQVIQSPDTLAVEYKTPLWSERHWELVARSLRLIGETGNRIVNVPLICRTNMGNDESMVRWIKDGKGGYTYDYSVMEKYLDAAAGNLGRPKIVVFWAWDVLLTKPGARFTEPAETDSTWLQGEKARMRARVEQSEKGIPVTGLDPATGAVETINLPDYSDPASKALWQPVWTEIRQRMARRGLEKTMMLGMLSDWDPSPEEIALFNDMTGGLPWASCSHHLRSIVPGKTLGKVHRAADIGMAIVALDFDFVINPDKGRMYGWKMPYVRMHCWQFPRAYFNAHELSTVRQEVECDITGGQRGVGRVGADFWPCVANRAGRRVATVTDRYPECYWHSLDVGDFLLAPGPDGPVGTARLELFREGLQECEARIAIESVLTDEALRRKIGAELAERAQRLLDERQRALWTAKGATAENMQMDNFRQRFWNLWLKEWDRPKGNAWFISSGWQQRTAQLYATAGEVQRKVAAP